MSVVTSGSASAGISGLGNSEIRKKGWSRRLYRRERQAGWSGRSLLIGGGPWPKRTPYRFVAAAMLLLRLLTFLPAANMLWYSFKDWSGLGPIKKVVGLDNYFQVFTNPHIFSVFGVSLYYFVGAFV